MIAKAAAAVGKVAAVAGKVGAVAGKAGAAVGKAAAVGGKAVAGGAKVAGGAAKTALVGSKGKVVTQAGGKFAGVVGRKSGLLQKAGGFAKGAAKEGLGMKIKPGASGSVKAGSKTAKFIKKLKEAGGGSGGGGAQSIQPVDEEAPVGPGQTQFRTRKIGGNPLHYNTHIKKKGKSPEPKRTVLQNPGADPSEKKRRKIITNPRKTVKVMSSSKGIPTPDVRRRGKPTANKKVTKKITSPKKEHISKVRIPEVDALEKISSKYSPEDIRAFAGERNIEIPADAFGDQTQVTGEGPDNRGIEGVEQGIPRPEQAGEIPESGLETPIESRDVKEPFLSKLIRGVSQVATAGAPPAIRGLVDKIGGKYAKRQQKVETSRDLIWKLADELIIGEKGEDPKVQKKKIDNFLKNPEFTEAFTNRLPGINTKEDVHEFLTMSMEEDAPSPMDFMDKVGWKPGKHPEEGITVDVGEQGATIIPKPMVVGEKSRLVTAGGEVKTKTVPEEEFDTFKAAQLEEDPTLKPMEIIMNHAAMTRGRYETKVAGKSIFKLDKFTGKQTEIQAKDSDAWRSEPMRDEFGKIIGIMFYNNNSIDENFEPESYEKILFKDIIDEDGKPKYSEEEIRASGNTIWDEIMDAWHGLTGTKPKTKPKGKGSPVKSYIDGAS